MGRTIKGKAPECKSFTYIANMKTVTYFSGSYSGHNPAYVEAARRVGDFIGRQKCLAKYGGSSSGLMGAFCFALKASAEESHSSAKIIGIMPRKYATVNKPETLGIEFTVTETLTERKHLLIEGADAFLVLPGGIGTLDEIFETIETDYVPADRDPTIGDYTIRPIYILNMDGYYNPIRDQLARMEHEGFLVPTKMINLFFLDTLDEYLAALEQFFVS